MTLAATGATLALTAASVLVVAAARPTTVGPGAAPGRFAGSGCTAPALPGSVVEVVAMDMGPRGGMPMMGGAGAGRMALHLSTSSVPAGKVSIVVVNRGTRTHELVVLPLAAGSQAGQRPVEADRTVDESGSLGEASRGCAAGEGEGIVPGRTGWVTLTLAPGRYELLCNLPGHYAAGMWAELDVT
jgi:uncharacterized cupredoxin-like copper-binding protein